MCLIDNDLSNHCSAFLVVTIVNLPYNYVNACHARRHVVLIARGVISMANAIDVFKNFYSELTKVLPMIINDVASYILRNYCLVITSIALNLCSQTEKRLNTSLTE